MVLHDIHMVKFLSHCVLTWPPLAGKNLSAKQETLVRFLGGEVPGEGIGYPLQYSWASLVVHMVKNPPAMQETWV